MDWSGAMCAGGLVRRNGPRWNHSERTEHEENVVLSSRPQHDAAMGADTRHYCLE